MQKKHTEFQRLRILSLITAIFFGLIYVWSARQSMTADGISYLDIADAFLSKDWKGVINASWSSLYPFLISIGFCLFKPTAPLEFPVVHLVNFLIYLFTLLCFSFFINEVIKFNSKKITEDLITIPNWAVLVLGYSLFIFSSLILIGLWGADPDMLASAFVYLASGILVHISRKSSNWLTFVFLGIVLGLGYLAKTAMFPLAFVYLITALFTDKNSRKNITKFFLAFMIFLLISSPLIVALSKSKGHLTIGESGKINYAWYINDTPVFVHWQGESPGKGKLRHPTRKIFNSPAVYEFTAPIGGTYPPWFDFSYWYDGVQVHFDPICQLAGICASMKVYYRIFFKLLGFLLVGLFILFYMGGRKKNLISDLQNQNILIVPSLAAFFMFSLVHLEPRYIGAFIVVFLLGLFLAVRLPKSQEKLIEAVVISVSAMTMLTTGTVVARDVMLWEKYSSQNTELKIVQGLKHLGIKEGDKVATIGYLVPNLPYWARLAKVKIVSEITLKDSDKFWQADSKTKSEVIKAFEKTGARIIVADKIPQCCSKDGWERVESTDIFVYLLD